MTENIDFKEKVKTALIEIINEDSNALSQLFLENLEDKAFGFAISEGDRSDFVEESAVLDLLRK